MSKPIKEDYIIRIKSSIDQLDNEGSVREEARDQIELMTRGSLVKKGYVEKIQSTTDRREYFLRPTQKYIDYYSISYSYLHTVIERVRQRFPAEDCDKMEQMLSVISTELMPELDMLAKCRHPEAPAEDTTH